MTRSIEGTSGAVIHLCDYHCVKVAGDPAVIDRLQRQAEMMERVGRRVFPGVGCIWDGGYSMELLVPLDWTVEPVGRVIRMMKSTLVKNLWSIYASHVDFDALDEHLEYMTSRCRDHAPHLLDRMQRWFTRDIIEPWDYLSKHLTHGDPTLDNVMQSRGVPPRLVITDPIPSSFKMPDLRAVDLGKMLQSAYGYEYVKYGRSYDMTHLQMVEEILTRETGVDRLASFYFAAVHYLRLIPYQPADLRPRFVKILERIVYDRGPSK